MHYPQFGEKLLQIATDKRKYFDELDADATDVVISSGT